MRFSFLLVPVLACSVAACGGSTESPIEDRGGHVPATPLPSERASSDRPTGVVTLLSIDGGLLGALPSFYETPPPSSAASRTAPCALTRSDGERPREVSAGTLAFTVPTREGTSELEVFFDRSAGEYEPASFEAFVEPGGILQLSASGDVAPAFDAELEVAANVAFGLPDIVELDANAATDIPLTWTVEGDNDEVFVDLGIGATSVTCWFDSKARRGTIPAALVSELLAEGGSCESPASCVMFLASKRTKTVSVEDWAIVLSHGFATIKSVHVTR